jgi:hypothetical protein
MFALVDVKEENGTMDLFPHDCMLEKKNKEDYFLIMFCI